MAQRLLFMNLSDFNNSIGFMEMGLLYYIQYIKRGFLVIWL